MFISFISRSLIHGIQETVDLFTFAEEIFTGNLRFLCSVRFFRLCVHWESLIMCCLFPIHWNLAYCQSTWTKKNKEPGVFDKLFRHCKGIWTKLDLSFYFLNGIINICCIYCKIFKVCLTILGHYASKG